MKVLVITFSVNDGKNKIRNLKQSLNRLGFHYHIFETGKFSWGGDNYTPMIEWLKDNSKDFTHIIYTDAWDTVALGGPDELCEKYKAICPACDAWLYSAEKNCFPRGDWSHIFPDTSRWRFLNAGGFMAPIDLFISIVTEYGRKPEINDQEWGSENFCFNNGGRIMLDTQCEIFQTLYNYDEPITRELAMCDEKRIVNMITMTKPIFIHGNGRADMNWVYNEL